MFHLNHHNVLLSKIARSTLPDELQSKQTISSKSKERIVHTSVPQCSKSVTMTIQFQIANVP